MLKGTVKFFNKAKGFGFITPDDGDKEIFLPASAVPAPDVARLKPGQRVSFEQAPDTKGPKAVSLTFLAEAPRPPEVPAPRLHISLLHNPADPASAEVIEVLTELGHAPRLVDYMAAPPPPDELRRISLLLNGADQSLVRRYDPLFLELQLDDRFITESEFWTGVFEHPQLINGPVLATPNKVRICRDEEDVRDFLGLPADAPVARAKALSPRIAAMMHGVEPPPKAAEPVMAEPAAPEAVVEAAPMPVKKAPKAAVAKAPEPKPIAAKKTAAPKAKKAVAAKPAVKKAVAKPAKKKAPAAKKR